MTRAYAVPLLHVRDHLIDRPPLLGDHTGHLVMTNGASGPYDDRLVSHGLVSRRADPHDRRVRRVELTDAGTKLLAEINDVGLDHYRRIMDHLDAETLRCLLQVTTRVREVADQLYP